MAAMRRCAGAALCRWRTSTGNCRNTARTAERGWRWRQMPDKRLIDANALVDKVSLDWGLTHQSQLISATTKLAAADAMCKLLGEELYNDFLAHREEDVWKAFEGMIADKSVFISPIANYVYFYLVRDSHATATINGVKKDGEENLVSPQRKMVRAWNDMVEHNRRIYSWLCRTFHKVQTDQELLEPINDFNV